MQYNSFKTLNGQDSLMRMIDISWESLKLKWLKLINEIFSSHEQTKNEQVNFRNIEVQCLSRDGRVINFVPFVEVPAHMEKLTQWMDSQETQIKGDPKALAHFCSVFWISFISIHPYRDHNGKTALKVIETIAQKQNFSIDVADQLKSYLLIGNPQEDMSEVLKIISAGLKDTK